MTLISNIKVNKNNIVFFQNIYEEENFEYLLYKANTNTTFQRNLLTLLFKYESSNEKANLCKLTPIDMTNFFSETYKKEIQDIKLDALINIDDIVINPIFKNMEEIFAMLERIKSDYMKSLVVIKNYSQKNYSSTQTRNDNNYNKKLFQSSHIIDLNLKVNISKIVLDMYSYFTKNYKTPELKDR